MSKFNAITPVALTYWGREVKIALIAAAVIIPTVAALLGGIPYSQAYADSPTPSSARASQSPGDASQTLRRYALQLLRILSNPDANQWERYRQAMPHCAGAPARLAEIDAASDGGSLDAALAALTEDLCSDLERRLDEARTLGLLVNEPDATRGYVLIPGGFNNYIHLIDHLGRVAHSWRLEDMVSHAKLLDNGNLLIGYGLENAAVDSIRELAPDSSIIWQYTHPDTIHHDFLKMPNGNVLMLMSGVKTMEEAIAAGVNPDSVPSTGMDYDYLIEVRPTGTEGGEIVWKWSTWDYLVQDFDASRENYGNPSDHPELIDVNYILKSIVNVSRDAGNTPLDWLHANAIDYNPALEHIMISPRNFSELWIIDRSASTEDAPTRKGGNSGKGGALLYRWGNPRAYKNGTVADQRLFWQHHTQWIAPGLPGEGNILVFNNGYELDLGKDPRFYSSIDEIVPPVDRYRYRREPGEAYPPAAPIWTYTAEKPMDFYSRLISSVQRLPNGNTLICEGMSGNVFQVTPDGRTVWQYVYPIDGDTPLKQGEQPSIWRQLWRDTIFNNAVYRAYWYAPDHPGLRNYDLTPGDTIELYE